MPEADLLNALIDDPARRAERIVEDCLHRIDRVIERSLPPTSASLDELLSSE